MSIMLDGPELMAMQLVGLPWPNIDEDELRNYAEHLRTFASSMADTHGQAHGVIAGLAETNSGPAYEALIERWAHVSTSHLHELVEACRAIATALDVAAGAVEWAKNAILVALGVIVASFVADTAAAIFTLGASEAIEAAVIEGVRVTVKGILDQLEQMVVADALQAAVGPFEDQIAAAIQGMVLHGLQAAVE